MRRCCQKLIIIICLIILVSNLCGCETVARKFARRHNTQEISQQDMVLVPQEYVPNVNVDQAYQEYLLYVKSWQDELINALSLEFNLKRQVSSVNEAVKNIHNLKGLLNPAKQRVADKYIVQMNKLKEAMTSDIYGALRKYHKRQAEAIAVGISRELSYSKVKDDIVRPKP